MIDIEVYSRIVGVPSDDVTLSPIVLKLFEEKITVAELIERTVEEQIRDLTLNRRLDAEKARRVLDRQYLTQREIDDQIEESGALRFPTRRAVEGEHIKVANQVKRALQGFEEGAYLILVDGEQMQSLDEKILLGLHTKITFLRLTPLVGG